MKPFISIIVPVYNVEKYLNRCMETLLNQTMKNIEVILVDDGSPDNCPAMCDEYKCKDSRIRVIHKKNGGLGFARNSGIDIAEGEYVAFVDSDDYVTTDMCEKLYAAAKKHNADVVYGGIFYKSDASEKAEVSLATETVWKGRSQVDELLLNFIATPPGRTKDTIMEVSVWKAIFRRSLFQDNQIRFVSERQFISEDVIFDIDFLQKCDCIVSIPDPIYYYCVNPNSLSKTFRADRFLRVKELYAEINRRLAAIFPNEIFQLRCDRFLLARARTNAKAIVRHKKIIGTKKAREAIAAICEDEDLQKILHRYPIRKLPLQQFAVAFLMKNKLCSILMLLLRLK